jgi:acyl carrier protein
MTIEDRILNAFREGLELPPGDINTDELVYREFKKWTSMAHMSLIAILEQDFDVMLETDEILQMSSFSKVVEIMKNYDESAA